jgi:pentatricopeptide repeat protein
VPLLVEIIALPDSPGVLSGSGQLKSVRSRQRLRGSEGTFSLCTGWCVDALTRSGRLDEARLTFEKMLTYGNRLGLFSEEIGITGEQLGNFPQAFTHLSLINAALNLDHQLDRQKARRTA